MAEREHFIEKCDSARAMRAGLLMAERKQLIQTQVFAGGPLNFQFSILNSLFGCQSWQRTENRKLKNEN
ncbi:MAG: hypothetical protein J5980_00950 [Muribaculaceae bacterium]|nr:hypothetical protein [Muribaculaceae bacterium]